MTSEHLNTDLLALKQAPLTTKPSPHPRLVGIKEITDTSVSTCLIALLNDGNTRPTSLNEGPESV